MTEPKQENMTEPEFMAQMLRWANDGHFDQPDPCLNLKCSFEWMMNAEDEYIRMGVGRYAAFGHYFVCTTDSKTRGIMLDK